jgi:glycosyltransferase involved in cell wall biosynthesis
VSEELVSVIVPVYNGARFLVEALDSVFAQTYRPLEVIVIDDGSTDESGTIARTYPDVRYIRQSNAGVSAARNRGVEAASGQLLAFLDQDDVWFPDKIRKQADALMARPTDGFVLCQQVTRLERGDPLPGWARFLKLEEALGSFVPSGWLLRRSVFEQVGPFGTDYANGQDTDWLARAKDACVDYGMVEEPLLVYRIHRGNASGNTETSARDLLRLLRESVHRQAGAAIGD